MGEEVRLIDANEVGAKIQVMYIRREIDYGGENEFCRGMRKALRIIEDAPTVEAQPVKHGRWIEKEAYEEDKQMGFNFQIVCSECDQQNSVLYFDDNSEPTEKYFMRTPWCPWCGARMDGGSE